jgi:hypothetical protein
MNNALLFTGRWVFGCLLAATLGFVLGFAQDRGLARPESSNSRIQWPADAWGHR